MGSECRRQALPYRRRAGRVGAEPVHGGARRHHREHRHAEDRRRPGQLRPLHLAVHLLLAHLHAGDASVRRMRDALRPQAGVRMRHQRVRRRIGGLRAVERYRRAHGVARRARCGRGPRGGRRVHRDGRAVRTARAREVHGHPLVHVRPGFHRRSASRRADRRYGGLALDLPGQPAVERGGARAGRAVPPGQASSCGTVVRPARGRVRGRRHRAAHACVQPDGQRVRLVLRAVLRAARARGRHDRAARAGRTATRPRHRAGALLPSRR